LPAQANIDRPRNSRKSTEAGCREIEILGFSVVSVLSVVVFCIIQNPLESGKFLKTFQPKKCLKQGDTAAMKVDLNMLKNIKGFLDQEEGQRLYEIALEASAYGPCLEIGSYCGKSTVYIGMACKENNSQLFAIDHHLGSEDQQPGELYFDPELYNNRYNRADSFPAFRQTLITTGLTDTVVPIVCPSEMAARFWHTPVSMLFIDGGHSYDAAYMDYNSWCGHVMPGGYLMIHDIFRSPAEGGQAPHHIYKLAMASGLFQKLPMTKSLGVLRRRSRGELPQALAVS
jgi:hypothetical protein